MFYRSRSSLLPLPAGGECRPYRPPYVLRLLPTSLQVRASLVEAPLLCASTNDRCGFRVDRLFLPACLRFLPTPLLRHGAGPLRLLLHSQTIFTLPFPLYPRHLRLRLRRRVRSNYSVPRNRLWRFAPQRNLRLLFRLARTGICTAAYGRRTADIRHHPPTHKRTDERTDISRWHSLSLVCDALFVAEAGC